MRNPISDIPRALAAEVVALVADLLAGPHTQAPSRSPKATRRWERKRLRSAPLSRTRIVRTVQRKRPRPTGFALAVEAGDWIGPPEDRRRERPRGGSPSEGVGHLEVIKAGEIDRMIELKSSGVDAQVQAMSWNVWKTAQGSLRSRFWLYLIGNLHADLIGRGKLANSELHHRLFNLAPLIPEDERYSRIYRGRRELIDHLLVSHALLDAVNTVTTGGDATPSISDHPGERRDAPSSDHRPVLMILDV